MICESWEGSTIDGKFPLLEWLGGWADHCVFLTVRQGTQRANIKLTSASGAEADAHLAYWETAKTLSHPCLLQLMESGRYTIQGTEVVYVITEKADNFLSALIPRKALDAPEVKQFLEPVADALMFLHEKGFGHGSVRPSNIVQVETQWKLTSEKMSSGEIQGKKLNGYDAPETASGELTPASDVWSLGMIIVEAFEQRTASWDSDSKNDPVVPRSMPQPFFDIARGCLRWDPAGRISMAEVKSLLSKDRASQMTEPAARWNEPVAVEPPPKVEAKEEFLAEKPNPFGQSEPAEFAPRSRLFTNLGEDDDQPSRTGPMLVATLIMLAVIAGVGVFGYRAGWFQPAETQKAPTQNQPATPPPQLQPAPPIQSQSAPSASESSPATQPPQTQGAPEEPKPQQPEVQKQQEPAPAAEAPQPAAKPQTTAPPAEEVESNSKGAVVKRVLPDISPGASQSMRRAVEIELRVSVNQEGTVSRVEYTSQGPGNYFARKAYQAAKTWKFKPPENEGQAAASEWVLLFQFDRSKTEVRATQVR